MCVRQSIVHLWKGYTAQEVTTKARLDLIGKGRQKLAKQIAVGSMELDHIEASLVSPKS